MGEQPKSHDKLDSESVIASVCIYCSVYLRNAQILLYAVPVCLFLSVLLQVLLLLAYYRFGHQWTRILFPGKPSKTNGEDGEGGRGEREKEEGGEEVGTAEKIELVEMGSSNRD